jgi:hypothetical protein
MNNNLDEGNTIVEELQREIAAAELRLVAEFNVPLRQVRNELRRRKREGTLRETAAVTKWLSVYSSLMEELADRSSREPPPRVAMDDDAGRQERPAPFSGC